MVTTACTTTVCTIVRLPKLPNSARSHALDGPCTHETLWPLLRLPRTGDGLRFSKCAPSARHETSRKRRTPWEKRLIFQRLLFLAGKHAK